MIFVGGVAELAVLMLTGVIIAASFLAAGVAYLLRRATQRRWPVVAWLVACGVAVAVLPILELRQRDHVDWDAPLISLAACAIVGFLALILAIPWVAVALRRRTDRWGPTGVWLAGWMCVVAALFTGHYFGPQQRLGRDLVAERDAIAGDIANMGASRGDHALSETSPCAGGHQPLYARATWRGSEVTPAVSVERVGEVLRRRGYAVRTDSSGAFLWASRSGQVAEAHFRVLGVADGLLEPLAELSVGEGCPPRAS